MRLQTRVFWLVAVPFGILYSAIIGVVIWVGPRSAVTYTILAFGVFILYFIANPLVLHGSRIREYYAGMGSV